MQLSVIPNNAGSVSVETGEGTESWGWWKSYRLTATAATGYVFSHFEVYWTYVSPNGTETGTGNDAQNPCGSLGISLSKHGPSEFEADYQGGDHYEKCIAVRAIFISESGYQIAAVANVNPPEAVTAGCTATVSPSLATSQTEGSSAAFSFTASAASGWRFVNWSDGSTDASNHTVQETFGPERHKTISRTANFSQTGRYLVTVSVSPVRAGTTAGGGNYDQGDTCTINTTPHCSPWTFDHWELTPGGSVNTRQHSFHVTNDTTCVAHYTHSNTGRPYDQNGSILCSSDGDILYDGNSVNQ